MNYALHLNEEYIDHCPYIYIYSVNYVFNLSTTITAYKYRRELRLQPAYYDYSVNFVFNLSTAITIQIIQVNYVFNLCTTITR